MVVVRQEGTRPTGQSDTQSGQRSCVVVEFTARVVFAAVEGGTSERAPSVVGLERLRARGAASAPSSTPESGGGFCALSTPKRALPVARLSRPAPDLDRRSSPPAHLSGPVHPLVQLSPFPSLELNVSTDKTK